MSLIDKIRKAREVAVEADGKQFTIRRPTDEEAAQLQEATAIVYVKKFTMDWELTELDIIPGGGPEKVPFDAALFAEWVADKPTLWIPLGTAILDAYRAHCEKREVAEKN